MTLSVVQCHGQGPMSLLLTLLIHSLHYMNLPWGMTRPVPVSTRSVLLFVSCWRERSLSLNRWQKKIFFLVGLYLSESDAIYGSRTAIYPDPEPEICHEFAGFIGPLSTEVESDKKLYTLTKQFSKNTTHKTFK